MDFETIIRLANQAVKPTIYKLGESTIYIRKCTAADLDEFLEAQKDEAKQSKLWAIAYGVCDEKNQRLYEKPEDHLDQFKQLMRSDLNAISDLVLTELGLAGIDAAKKD